MELPQLEEILQLLPDQIGRLLEQGEPWLRSYGVPALAIGSFLETFFLTGALLPGFALILAAGYLAGTGVLDLWAVLIASAGGVVAGDQLSFALGRYGSARLLRRWVERSDRFGAALLHEGPVLLLIYHYSPLLRSVVPLACGHTRYVWRIFTPWATVGALLWVALVVAIGYLAHGAAHFSGNMFLLAVEAASFVLLVYVSWRVARYMRRLVCKEVEQTAQLGDS